MPKPWPPTDSDEVHALQALLGGGLPERRRVGDRVSPAPRAAPRTVRPAPPASAPNRPGRRARTVIAMGIALPPQSINRSVGNERYLGRAGRVRRRPRLPGSPGRGRREASAVVDRRGQVAPHGVGGVPGDVRGDDDVVQGQQRIVRRAPVPRRTRRGPAAASRPRAARRPVPPRRRSAPREVLTSTASGFIAASASRVDAGRRWPSVSGRCSETMSLAASSSGRVPPAGVPVVAGAGVQHVGAHRRDDPLDPLGDVAVADQSRRCSRRCRGPSRRASASEGQPRPAAGGAVQFGQPAQRGQHQQHRALGDRRRVGARHVGHGDTAAVAVVDVDGVDPGAQLVHQLASSGPLEVGHPRRAAGRARSPRPRAVRGGRCRRRPRRRTGRPANPRAGQGTSATLSPGVKWASTHRHVSATASRSTWRWYRPARCAPPEW